MTTSSWPNSTRRSAAQYPADPVPTTTVFAVTTGTSRPAMRRFWGSWEVTGKYLVRSEGGDVHAAVDVDDVAGGVGHLAGDELRDGAADVGGPAPAGDGRAAGGEERVVLLGDARRHVGGDDAGADLVDDDPLGREARGPQLGRHRHAGLGDAVLAAV